jgi:hypothetical protein
MRIFFITRTVAKVMSGECQAASVSRSPTWIPKRRYFFGHFAYDLFLGHTAYMPKFRILSCTHAVVIVTQIYFLYVSNMFSILFQYFSISFQYCPILQLFNRFSICFQYLSIFFKHATCRHILPNMGK